MRIATYTTVALLLAGTNVRAQKSETKVPGGCEAVAGATVSYEGYASKVIHERTGTELVLVPAGSFRMGDFPAGTGEVTFRKPFYMGKTEVTNGQYKKFIEETGYDGSKEVDPVYDTYLLHVRGKSRLPAEDNYPVLYVSWRNAKAFCDWARLDLPTEAEWEYCCRAGTTTTYSFGDNHEDFGKYGWCTVDSEGHPHEVAGLLPNAWGLYDMHGNVWEWCLDDFIDIPRVYTRLPNGQVEVRDPVRLPSSDGSARYDGRMTKVIRGASWGCASFHQPSGSEFRFSTAPTNATNDLGFRVVLRLAEEPRGDTGIAKEME